MTANLTHSDLSFSSLDLVLTAAESSSTADNIRSSNINDSKMTHILVAVASPSNVTTVGSGNQMNARQMIENQVKVIPKQSNSGSSSLSLLRSLCGGAHKHGHSFQPIDGIHRPLSSSTSAAAPSLLQ